MQHSWLLLYLSITVLKFINACNLQKELPNFAMELHVCLTPDSEKLKEIL